MYIKKSENTQISKQRNLKRMNHKLYLHNLKTKNTKHTQHGEYLTMGEGRKALKKAFCLGAYMVRGRERRERKKNEKLK